MPTPDLNLIAFGPVPSRRLGRSLGINNIPPKVCTYSCVYCQVGRTAEKTVTRRAFYDPQEILREVAMKSEAVQAAGDTIDYLTFVPDGEPTLDINLGHEIELLQTLGSKIAVITNASLLWQPDVRQDLVQADWVSLKVDAVQEDAWRTVNRPAHDLRLDTILDGMREFARDYRGELATETMLVRGVNDSEEQLQQIGEFLAQLKPLIAYLALPTRPPAEKKVRPPDENTMTRAYEIFGQHLLNVEYLIGDEAGSFIATGDVEQDLLSITAVHPMREEAVQDLLTQAHADWAMIDQLIAQKKLAKTHYEGKTFYMRRLHHDV